MVAPDQNKFYWDYSDDTNKTGYGLLFRGKDVGPGVKCMLRERRRGTVSIDAKYDDTYFIEMLIDIVQDPYDMNDISMENQQIVHLLRTWLPDAYAKGCSEL